MTPGDPNPYDISMDELERSAHVPLADQVETEPEMELPRELPDSSEAGARVPLQPRRVSLPDGHGEIDRQLARVLIGVVVLAVVAVVYFLLQG